MPKRSFVVWLTNPLTVAERDPYFDRDGTNLPNELPITPVIQGRNRADRVVAMLRQRDGQARFRISEFPPDRYKPEQTNIGSLYDGVGWAGFGRSIRTLSRRADEVCKLVHADEADLAPIENELPGGRVGDADKREPEFRIDEKAKPPKPLAPAWQRMVLEPQSGGDSLATLDGTPYRVGDAAFEMLGLLKGKQGNMVLASTIFAACGDRAARIYKSLPSALKDIIDKPESGKRGYRML